MSGQSVGRIELDLGVNHSGFKSELTGIANKAKGLASSVFPALGLAIGGAFAVNKVIEFGKAAIDVASDLIEVQNVVDVTFKEMAQDVNIFSKNALKEFGLSELSAKQYTSTMGAMLKSSGITGEAVKDMSIEMSKLTADMASFYNLDSDVAFSKIRAGISGQTEPLKQLGINMNIANLEAFALSQGIAKSYDAMSQAEQVMLRYNYLLKVSADSQGDFSRNVGTWANQTKILKEQWKEFMSLIGKALVEILLPAVKILNQVLETLIKITHKIGEIYAMITGKQVAIETNESIGETAEDAAAGEDDLAKGIDKASKAAKNALMPFDELNILQDDLGSGGGGKGPSLSDFDTSATDEKVIDNIVDGVKKTKDEVDKFYIWFGDIWNKLKELLMSPILVPAPIFATIPSPVYNPDWGLDLPRLEVPVFQPIPNPVYEPTWGLDIPLIPAPVFQPIPKPVYNPTWGLDVPLVSAPVFQSIPNPVYEPAWNLVPPQVPVVEIPPINYNEYAFSLQELNLQTSEAFSDILENTTIDLGKLSIAVSGSYAAYKENALESVKELQTENLKLVRNIKTDVSKEMKEMSKGISEILGTIEGNLKAHKKNVAKTAKEIANVFIKNISMGFNTSGKNANEALTTLQDNMQKFGMNVGVIAAAASLTWVKNINSGLVTSAENLGNFFKSAVPATRDWAVGMLRISADWARNFVSNIVGGLRTAWDNIKNYAKAAGESVSGWFSENKKVVTTVAIAGAAIGAGILLAPALPGAITYAAGALAGLSSMPALGGALAKGGIVDQPTLAMIGEAGKEAVVPLENTEFVTTLADAIAMSIGNVMSEVLKFYFDGDSSSTNQEKELIIEMEGTKLARVLLPFIDRELQRLGYKTILQT